MSDDSSPTISKVNDAHQPTELAVAPEPDASPLINVEEARLDSLLWALDRIIPKPRQGSAR